MAAGVAIYSWAMFRLCRWTLIVLLLNHAVEGALIAGYCARCGIVHSLATTEKAKQAALDLRKRLMESGRMDVDELPHHISDKDRDNLDPSLATERLYERRGKMVGVLVCHDLDSEKQVILKAYAGKLGGQWNVPGWAPRIGPVPESLPEFRKLSAEVTELFGRIDDLTNATHKEGGGEQPNDDASGVVAQKVKRLTKERARLATLAMDKVRRHQLVTNFRGETFPLTAIFGQGPTTSKRLPGGVGDCAAPKLLAEAARLQLIPTGIAEVFVGATGGMSTTKHDGEFYDACQPRCEPIAGFMLCGLEEE